MVVEVIHVCIRSLHELPSSQVLNDQCEEELDRFNHTNVFLELSFLSKLLIQCLVLFLRTNLSEQYAF